MILRPVASAAEGCSVHATRPTPSGLDEKQGREWPRKGDFSNPENFAIGSKASTPLPLPLFATAVQAGFPSPAENDVEKTLDLNELLISHPAATFFVRVSGDSMQGAGIFSGDVLVVNRSLEPADNKIVVAIVNSEFTVKRLKLKEGRIFLVPENPSYPTLEMKEESDFQVWGVVTYVIHKAV